MLGYSLVDKIDKTLLVWRNKFMLINMLVFLLQEYR